MRLISLQFFSTLILIWLISLGSHELLANSAATTHQSLESCGSCHSGAPIENFVTFEGPNEIFPNQEYLFQINVPNSQGRNGYQLKVIHSGPKAGDFIDSNGNILQAISTNERSVSDKVWAETDFNGVDNFREFRWRSGPDANALPSFITFTAILVDGSNAGTTNSRAGLFQVTLENRAPDGDSEADEEDIEQDPGTDSIDETENRFRSTRSSNFSGNFQGGCAQITSVKALSANALISWLSFLTISFFGLLLSIRISRKQAKPFVLTNKKSI